MSTDTSSDESNKALDHFNSGNTLYAQQRYQESITEYSNAIQLNNSMPQFFYNRGIAYHDIKQWNEAIEDFSQSLKLDPKKAAAYTMRGNCFKQLGNYEEAVKDYTNAIELQPNYKNALLGRALCYDRLSKYKDAVDDYSKVIELEKSNPSFSWFYNRGVDYMELEKYKEAIQDFSKAYDLSKGSYIDAIYQRAQCYEMMKLKDCAIFDYLQVITEYSKHLQALHAVAYLFYEDRDYERACEMFGQVINLDPEDYNSHYNRGLCWMKLGKPEEAIRDFKATILVEPEFQKAYIQIARLQSKLKKYKDSIQNYTKALEFDEEPDVKATLYFERGVVYNLEKQYTEAVQDFTSCIKLDPNFVDSFYNRAVIYHHELKEFENALQDYNKVLELAPEDESVLCDRGVLYGEMGKIDLAKADLENVLKINPENNIAKELLTKFK